MKYFLKVVEWLGVSIIVIMFVLALVISMPIVLLGDIMNSKHRRRIG